MSKGLEALVWVRQYEYVNPKLKEKLDIIEEELKEKERLKTSYLENLLNEESKQYIYKKLKALEIIKEKRVDVYLLILAIKKCKDKALNYYNHSMPTEQLTKEEYNLLKEVML